MDIIPKYDPRMAILLDPKGQSISVKIKSIIKEEDKDKDDKDKGKKEAVKDDLTNTQASNPKLLRGATLGGESTYNVAAEDMPQNENLAENYQPVQQTYGKHIKKLKGIDNWVKGIKLFIKQRLIVAWIKEMTNQDKQAKDADQKKVGPQIMFYSLNNYGQY